MREIKFRAWTGKEMVMDALKASFTPAQVYMGIQLPDSASPSFVTCSAQIYMQYAGLKDANGVEIYEGDIVAQEWIKKDRYDSGEFVYGVIKFVGCCFVESYKISERQEDFEEIDGENCVVVGNIYQNPELLK